MATRILSAMVVPAAWYIDCRACKESQANPENGSLLWNPEHLTGQVVNCFGCGQPIKLPHK
jgi:hypothetical protein